MIYIMQLTIVIGSRVLEESDITKMNDTRIHVTEKTLFVLYHSYSRETLLPLGGS